MQSLNKSGYIADKTSLDSSLFVSNSHTKKDSMTPKGKDNPME